MSNKNDGEIQLIITGEDEYSEVSEAVRDELSGLSKQARQNPGRTHQA